MESVGLEGLCQLFRDCVLFPYLQMESVGLEGLCQLFRDCVLFPYLQMESVGLEELCRLFRDCAVSLSTDGVCGSGGAVSAVQ